MGHSQALKNDGITSLVDLLTYRCGTLFEMRCVGCKTLLNKARTLEQHPSFVPDRLAGITRQR